MRLIIVRHGETEENKKGIIQGHLHGTLSELGIEQAKKLAERLKNEEIDLIFSSDLNRAKNTAEEIARFHPEIPFELKEELRERNWGEFEGKRKEDIDWTKIKWENIKDDEKKLKELGIETLEEGLTRAKSFMDSLYEHEDKTILLISHNQFLRALLATIINKKIEEIERHENTGVTIFEFDKNRNPELKLFNCVKHLEG